MNGKTNGGLFTPLEFEKTHPHLELAEWVGRGAKRFEIYLDLDEQGQWWEKGPIGPGGTLAYRLYSSARTVDLAPWREKCAAELGVSPKKEQADFSSIRNQFEAFKFILLLQEELQSRGEKAAADHLLFLLEGAGGFGGERVGLIVHGLKEFLTHFANLIDDMDRARLRQCREAYKNSMPTSRFPD